MKVVYNDCYGGFSLSDTAIGLYWSLKRLKGECGERPEDWYDRGLARNDPTLVQVVEMLGEKANGPHADLKIREVFAPWRIDEYDGSERVMTVADYKWEDC